MLIGSDFQRLCLLLLWLWDSHYNQVALRYLDFTLFALCPQHQRHMALMVYFAVWSMPIDSWQGVGRSQQKKKPLASYIYCPLQLQCQIYVYSLVEVFIQVTEVLVTCQEEDDVLIRPVIWPSVLSSIPRTLSKITSMPWGHFSRFITNLGCFNTGFVLY